MNLMRLLIMLSSLGTVVSVKYCSKINDAINKHEVENFTMVGVNMCSLKCDTRGYCWSIGYDVVTLMCHLLKLRLDSRDDCGQFTFIRTQKNTNKVGPCSSEICRDKRCLETRSGREVCVKGWKQAHPEITRQPKERRTCGLFDACKEGNLTLVKWILSDSRVTMNARCGRQTPLLIAVYYGQRQVYDFLVSRGADVHSTDIQGRNSLHVACSGGHVHMVKFLLLQNSAYRINSRDRTGATPAIIAATCGHRDVFDLLVNEGADVSLVTAGGRNVLCCATLGGHVSMVKHILSKKIVDINSRDKRGLTSVMWAAHRGLREVYDFLVSKGADLFLPTGTGRNIIHTVSSGGHIEMVKYILSQNISDINGRSTTGFTPAMDAALAGHLEAYRHLVSKGADVTLVNDVGSNVLHLACRRRSVQMAKYIISQNIIDINSQDNDGTTPVMCAACRGESRLYDLFVSEGADVSLVNNNGSNVLHKACAMGHTNIVKLILQQNVVNIHTRNSFGYTPAMVARKEGHMAIYKLLQSQARGGQ